MPRLKNRKTRVAAAPRRSTRDRASPDRLKPSLTPPAIRKKVGRPGRSRKVDVQLAEVKTPMSRGPGRPAKATKQATLTTSKPSAVSKAASMSTTPTKVIKKRGRPAKNASQANKLPAVVNTIKPETFTMSSITGHYEVECHAISSNWIDGFTQTLTMDIGEPDHKERVSAAFDISFVNGTLRIAASKEELGEWCGNEAAEADEAPVPPDALPGAGTRRTRADTKIKTRAKRVKLGNPADVSRVYFRWRGQSPHDGLRYLDHEEQTGWLDFPRADGNAFWGVIDLPITAGPGIAIHGIRVAKKPVQEPWEWEAFEAPISDSQEDQDVSDADPAPTAVMARTQKEGSETDGEEDIDSGQDGSAV